jgi:hypothetical protein
MWTFIPTESIDSLKAPYFEDARADFAPYYRSDKTIKQATNEVIVEIGKLNANVTAFNSGKFQINGQTRFGYEINFLMNGARGVIRVAGLPIKSYMATKEDKVRVQCLLNVRDWLKAAVTMQVFSPDTSPLMPYLLVDGKRTIAEYVLSGAPLALPSQVNVELIED